ncbi:MAG: DUF2059 domain-containing protein [Paracoccaceae bacterium]|nr:DUF2059 domain-containing protein [Paracoccaceae bacterium]
MIRRFFTTLGQGLCAALVLGGLGAAPVQADAARISDLLQTGPIFEILQQEGMDYGDDLSAEMLGQPADPAWRAEVAAIHAPDRLRPPYEAAFAAALEGSDQAAIEAWLGSDLGRRIVGLEVSARRALLDPDVEEAALMAAERADAAGDPRFKAVRAVIEAADLIEPNVMGGLNANLAFYRAMAAGQAFPYEVTETDMLAEVAAQEPDIRADVTGWIEGYLFMAYAPLSLDDLHKCAEFSASAPGRALMQAQFAAFDVIYETSSAALGTALARRLVGMEL